MNPHLHIYTPGGEIHEVEVLTDIVTIGSAEDNHLSLDEESVSPHHAVITRREDSFLLNDLGSEHGTFINKVRINSAELNNAVTLQFGKIHAKFYLHMDEKLHSSEKTKQASRTSQNKEEKKQLLLRAEEWHQDLCSLDESFVKVKIKTLAQAINELDEELYGWEQAPDRDARIMTKVRRWMPALNLKKEESTPLSKIDFIKQDKQNSWGPVPMKDPDAGMGNFIASILMIAIAFAIGVSAKHYEETKTFLPIEVFGKKAPEEIEPKK